VEEKRLFGEIAVQMGYLTVDQIKRALDIQREMRKAGEGHRLIGVLLVDLGYMSAEQVVDVLDAYDREREEELDAAPPPQGESGSEGFAVLRDETGPRPPRSE
jgi:hypothetical protein